MKKVFIVLALAALMGSLASVANACGGASGFPCPTGGTSTPVSPTTLP